MLTTLRPRLRSLIRGITRRRALQSEMLEEFRAHVEMRTEDLVQSGLSHDEARRRARLEFGSLERFAEEGGASRGLRWFDRLQLFWLDVRTAGRLLRRKPLYFMGTAGTLALGLAATLVIGAIAWGIWLAPMPYADPAGVVRLYELAPLDPTASPGDTDHLARRHQFSPALLEELRDKAWTSIESISAVLTGISESWLRDGESQRLSLVVLSPEGFGILGIVPELGRLPSLIEEEVIVSEGFWRSDLGADSSAIGSRLTLGNESVEIVGVASLPAGFPGDVDLVSIVEWNDANQIERELRFIDVIARVRPGHTVEEAATELSAFAAQAGEIHPEVRGWQIDTSLLSDELLRPFRPVIRLLLTAAILFLVLTGINVAGLIAARRIEGRQDRSIRLALGASEFRLLRSAVLESVLPATCGAVLAILIAYVLIGPIRALVPADVPRIENVTLDQTFVIGGLLLGIAIGVALGVSGHAVSRKSPSVLARPSRSFYRRPNAGRALVLAQVALTTFLASAGVAVLQGISTLQATDLGFEAEGIATASTIVHDGSSADVWNTWEQILEGLRSRGFSAAAGTNLPMAGEEMPPLPLMAESLTEEVFYEFHPVSPEYFSVMGVELIEGRIFGPLEGSGDSGDVVIVSEDVARRLVPGRPLQAAIGQVVGPIVGAGDATVVGIVEATRHEGPHIAATLDVYAPMAQYSFPPASLVVRAEVDQVASALSEVAATVAPELAWSPLIPYSTHLRTWIMPFRLQAVAIGFLGALGLLLASLGLYTVMAHEVASRRHEIGLRKAVGAGELGLMAMVIARGAAIAAGGLVIGLSAWYSLLPRVQELVATSNSLDAFVPAAVAAVVFTACLLSTLAPALRAASVHPAVTLKCE